MTYAKKLHLFRIFFIFLSLWLSTAFLNAADISIQRQKELLTSIEQYAMIYGEGEKKVYVFVDPKCPHSQDFISMVHESAKMRGMYRYYIFFYELKRFNSHDLIGTIYESSIPIQTTLEVMAGKKELQPSSRINSKTEEKITAISRVADEIGITKRPYLIIAKKLD